jgi:hypothetical protein
MANLTKVRGAKLKGLKTIPGGNVQWQPVTEREVFYLHEYANKKASNKIISDYC